MIHPDGLPLEPIGDVVVGPLGRAERVQLAGVPRAEQTVGHWLITAPAFHPLWSQYVLVVVRLDDDVPGFPPPHRQFLDATHELLVVSLDPESGPHTPTSLLEPGGLRYLTPVNVCHQFIATDDEMRQVLGLATRTVVHGGLNPESADAPATIRAQWLISITKTLAHIRGELHAP